jgi:hypothetical protein
MILAKVVVVWPPDRMVMKNTSWMHSLKLGDGAQLRHESESQFAGFCLHQYNCHHKNEPLRDCFGRGVFSMESTVVGPKVTSIFQ